MCTQKFQSQSRSQRIDAVKKNLNFHSFDYKQMKVYSRIDLFVSSDLQILDNNYEIRLIDNNF